MPSGYSADDKFSSVYADLEALILNSEDSAINLIYDHDQALSRLLGNEPLLISLLEQYLSEHDVRAVVLGNAVRSQEYTTIIEQAHAVRGVAANLSGHALYRAAQNLEEAVKNAQKSIEIAVLALVEADERFARKIRESIGDEQKNRLFSDRGISPDVLKPLFYRLKMSQSNEEFSITSLPEISEDPIVKDVIEQLVSAILSSDNDEALRLCEKVATAMGVCLEK